MPGLLVHGRPPNAMGSKAMSTHARAVLSAQNCHHMSTPSTACRRVWPLRRLRQPVPACPKSPATMQITAPVTSIAPQSIHHQTSAIALAEGPAGSSTDCEPAHAASSVVIKTRAHKRPHQMTMNA